MWSNSFTWMEVESRSRSRSSCPQPPATTPLISWCSCILIILGQSITYVAYVMRCDRWCSILSLVEPATPNVCTVNDHYTSLQAIARKIPGCLMTMTRRCSASMANTVPTVTSHSSIYMKREVVRKQQSKGVTGRYSKWLNSTVLNAILPFWVCKHSLNFLGRLRSTHGRRLSISPILCQNRDRQIRDRTPTLTLRFWRVSRFWWSQFWRDTNHHHLPQPVHCTCSDANPPEKCYQFMVKIKIVRSSPFSTLFTPRISPQ